MRAEQVALTYKNEDLRPGAAILDYERAVPQRVSRPHWQTEDSLLRRSWGWVEPPLLLDELELVPELLDVVDEDWRHETLAHDDFDLPHEDDSDTDEARSAPKRKVEEKWTELCLDDFTNPNGGRRGQPPRA